MGTRLMGTRLKGLAFGHARLDWTTGSQGLRRGLADETRYVQPSCLHVPALFLAMASSGIATLCVLGLGILRA